MEALHNKIENFQKKRDGFRSSRAKIKSFKHDQPDDKENQHNTNLQHTNYTSVNSKKSGKMVGTEIDKMKERFSKLLLGEDMSGSGKGACTALAISNAITNLCATVFGQLWRLEPLPCEKKEKWRREMEWLLCVSDHIVELTPSLQTFPDGSKIEVMICKPREDLFINLPALRKLDNMLFEILDSCNGLEFWYVDQGIVAPEEEDGSASFRKRTQRQEEKWWLPVPRVPPSGLSDNSRKQLNQTRECANQILKASMAINSVTLADMEVPESYLEALPKDVGKSILESYSRVLESMASNIVARIDDLLYVDDLTKHSDRLALVPTVHNIVSQQKALSVLSISATIIGPARGDQRTTFHISNNNNIIKPHRRGFGVRRVLSNYLGVETKATKIFSNSIEVNGTNPTSNKPEHQRESYAMKRKDNMTGDFVC